jgi:hypothetical protein
MTLRLRTGLENIDDLTAGFDCEFAAFQPNADLRLPPAK